ncbi:hypothetical protein ACIPIN_13915 [Pseudomonas sp. NPDC087697]|uniref:hypothetical protein n=1 Tax=Pseudomonas sp. NPDC087697 TaxID=3364447 RepID=UPI0038096AB0
MKIHLHLPGSKKPVQPILSGEAQQDSDELQENNPKEWKDVQSTVDNELEKLHDKARPLNSR